MNQVLYISLGHDTTEYYNLKNVIELLQNGLLEKFIKNDGKKPWNIFKSDKKLDNKISKNKSKKSRILVIYEGSNEGYSSWQRKQ